MSHITKKAGDVEVMVEPIHPTANQYGTDVERVPMPFGDFLNSLKNEAGPHPYLTTLTNEQIIAELGWTKKVIYDVLGVTPLYMRPPYGDIEYVPVSHFTENPRLFLLFYVTATVCVLSPRP